MYHCLNCGIKFDKLIQYQKEDKMYQLCPNCDSEEIELLTNLTEKDLKRFLRENKLERILKDEVIINKK
jgi:DNA-directed RNA polymerase subunit RPC12/RpoP